MRRLAWLAYTLTVALVALLLAVLWWAPGPVADWRHWQAPVPQLPSLDDVEAARLLRSPAVATSDPSVLQRPLFSSTRRPPPPEAKLPEPEPEPELPDIDRFQVQGIVAGPTLTGVMLEAEGTVRFVRVGDQLDGWKLARIDGGTVVFERAGQQHRLQLIMPGAAASPTPSNVQPSRRTSAAS